MKKLKPVASERCIEVSTREQSIVDITREAGKVYSFDNTHDPSIPSDLWFQESDEGLILFIVFYSQACRWSRCLGCNLPSKMSQSHVPYKSLVSQIEHIFQLPDVVRQREVIRKVIASNNGSMLDQKTFSSTALMYLLVMLNLHLPQMALLSLETRVEYVDLAELEFLSRAIAEGDTPTKLELAIGFEAFDDSIRNDVFRKGLSLEGFEAFVEKIAKYQYRLKCYFMQKPVPGMTDAEAIEDIQRAIDYLSQTSARYDVAINMHLNPTFVAKGTELEDAFHKGEYSPPLLEDVAEAVLHSEGKPLSVFIGLFDEGLAVQGGSFLREGSDHIVQQLNDFNKTLDYEVLKRICASC